MSNLKSRALVTGATGFIGSNLVRHLLTLGWEVHIVARPGASFTVLAPVLDAIVVHEHDGSAAGMAALVGQANPDVVYHLASCFLAQHRTSEVDTLIGSNVLFSSQLAEAMATHGIRYLINTGTSWQHHENAAYNPVNLYAATKQAFEAILAYYVEVCGLKVTTLALFDTYGAGDPRAKLISLLWKTALHQEPMSMSPGEQLIDLVHIDDVLAAFMLATEAIRTQESGHARYGVSSGQPITLRDLVTAFEQAAGTALPITWGGRPYRPREVMVPWNTYASVPGWTPKVPFEVGIHHTRPTPETGS